MNLAQKFQQALVRLYPTPPTIRAMQEVAEVDIEISENFDNAGEVFAIIRPSWKWEDVKSKALTAGITNKIVGFRHKSDDEQSDMVLIRRYGENTDLIIDRKAERRNMKLMHSIGCGSALYAVMNNAVAYEFLPGETTDVETVRTLREPIAKAMARMHSIDVSSNPDFDTAQPALYHKMEQFLKGAPAQFSDPRKQAQWETYALDRERLEDEWKTIRKFILENSISPLGFTHNDLLVGNIVFNEKTDRLTFIDYEYGDYNFVFFDIANHFNEYAGVEDVDYTRYPDKGYQREWLNIYFDAMQGFQSQQEYAELASNMDQVLNQIGLFSLCSNLFWGFWALVQAEYSTIDFDYVDYANLRLSEYLKKKDEFLAPFSK